MTEILPSHPDSNSDTAFVSRVAAVTASFWIMKILATTLGETAGDFISMTLNLGYYVGFAVTFSTLAVILYAKLQEREYHPVMFWVAIVATTTAGTEISDLMDRSLGLGYFWGSVLLVAGLGATLTLWYSKYRNLRVYPITDKNVEILFWIAVIFSNSLGTAFGDYLTDNAGLSYVQGAFVTASIIGVVLALHFATRINEVALFWIAFIFTRPFGATFGDFLTKPLESGGLNMPRELASLATLALLGGMLVLCVKSHNRQKLSLPDNAL